MEHRSTFDLMVGNALISQIDVMADIQADRIGEWYVAGVYMDAIEIDGRRCGNSRDYVRVPGTHPLYGALIGHFHTTCRDEIDDRWSRHSWRYTGERAAMFNDAGRIL